MARISVVLACFNGLPHILEQLASIDSQTRIPDELVICDDFSTDGTWELVQEYAHKACFAVRALRNSSQMGPARNFSTGVMHSTGDIVVLSDQDDWWEPTKLESIERYFMDHPNHAIAVHNVRICDRHLDISIDNYFEYLRHNNYSLTQFTKGCAMAVRRSVCEIAFPLPRSGSWMHDTRLLAVGNTLSSIGYLPDRLMRYRVHATNHSGYIFPSRGLAGRALAWMDTLALRASDPLSRAWSMYKERPITPGVVSEFGDIVVSFAGLCDPKHQDSAAIVRRVSARLAEAFNARARIAQRPGLIPKVLGYTVCLAKGMYAHSGHLYGYAADVGRALKH